SGVRGAAGSEVSIADAEWWDPPPSMDAVLAAMDPSENAKGEFDTGVLRITDSEYETAVAVGRRDGGPRPSTNDRHVAR
ncbi:MAG TPA: hypothetical protein VEC15_03310, partial [Actinomycetota bacterium]|nr:hypothetical protein [Actinomycetota bacterium]